jgi:ferredoxin--NADP+ reductase/benzoate/toluate 1,2-dioxygenase reductase subunit
MNVKIDKALYVIRQVRHLTDTTYVLRFSRNGMQFHPGQHLVMGLPGSSELREYSIYSGRDDDFLEVLIKEVDEGTVSRQLKTIKKGDRLEVRGPYGFFLNRSTLPESARVLFISSGTGIAPFHSYIQSHPDTDYRLIHGVRYMEEAYDLSDYRQEHIQVCTSRDSQGDFEGRLTDYLLETDLDRDRQVYLCGNSNMIYDAMDILTARGIPQRQIFTEVYF